MSIKIQYFIQSLLLISSLTSAEAALRTWIGGEGALTEHSRTDCNGLILPDRYISVILLKQRVVSQVLLPQTGAIALENGASLIFDENDHSCKEIELKKTNKNSPENWNPLENRAIPYLDRLPCQWDSIVIPQTNVVGIHSMWYRVKSAKIFDRNITDPSDYSLRWFNADLQTENACTRDTCACQSDILDDEVICASMIIHNVDLDLIVMEEEFPDEPNCLHPIFTGRACHRICGAVVNFESVDNTQDIRRKIEALLNADENRGYVDHYYGLAYDASLELYGQFIIVDKTVTSGGSYAHDIANKIKELLKDKSGIKVLTSGEPIIFGSFATSGPGMFLMTFALVVFVFLAIYIAFMTPVKQFDIRNMRINASTFRPFVFARFDNSGDVGDGEEDRRRVNIAFTHAAESTASSPATSSTEAHERAFDNPLYGQPTKSVTLHTPLANSLSVDEESNQPGTSFGEKHVRTKTKTKIERKHSIDQLLFIRDDEEDEEYRDSEEMADLHLNDEQQEEYKKHGYDKNDLKVLPEETSSSDDEENSTKERAVNSKEMLKFIEDNMKQVKLLDEQL